MRADPQFADQIQPPDDIRIVGRQSDRRFVGADHVLSFVAEWAVVAIRLPVNVEAQKLVRARDHIHPIAFDRRRGANPQILMSEVHVLGQMRSLGHGQLPKQPAVGLVETLDQPAVVASESRIRD